MNSYKLRTTLHKYCSEVKLEVEGGAGRGERRRCGCRGGVRRRGRRHQHPADRSRRAGGAPLDLPLPTRAAGATDRNNDDMLDLDCHARIKLEEALLTYLADNVGSEDTFRPVCAYLENVGSFESSGVSRRTGDEVRALALEFEVTYLQRGTVRDWHRLLGSDDGLSSEELEDEADGEEYESFETSAFEGDDESVNATELYDVHRSYGSFVTPHAAIVHGYEISNDSHDDVVFSPQRVFLGADREGRPQGRRTLKKDPKPLYSTGLRGGHGPPGAGGGCLRGRAVDRCPQGAGRR